MAISMPSQTDSIIRVSMLTIRLYYSASRHYGSAVLWTRAANNYCSGRVLFRKRAMIGSVIRVTVDGSLIK